MKFNYFIPTRILFGAGQLEKLHCQELPGKKAMIVTTAGHSVKKYGYLDTLEEELKLAGVEFVVFDKILPNPIKDHVMEGASIGRENGVDFVIGLGGGSAIDSAKAIAIMIPNEGDYWDYVGGGSGKGITPPNDPLPIVAITTTAGTGTEVDPWTVTTKTETNEKIGAGYEKTYPALAVVDPELMCSVPPHLTAYQGFDALFHSTEGYIHRGAYVMSDMYALKSIELIGKSLQKAVENGNDIDARGDVALANTLAGLVESTSGCISQHSIAHAISAFHPDFAHGAALISITTAYFTHWAQSGCCDERMVQMAKALGKEDAKEPMDFVAALNELKTACGVDQIKMSDYGMKYEDLEKYVKNARETMGGLYQGDPGVLEDSDVLKILQESFA